MANEKVQTDEDGKIMTDANGAWIVTAQPGCCPTCICGCCHCASFDVKLASLAPCDGAFYFFTYERLDDPGVTRYGAFIAKTIAIPDFSITNNQAADLCCGEYVDVPVTVLIKVLRDCSAPGVPDGVEVPLDDGGIRDPAAIFALDQTNYTLRLVVYCGSVLIFEDREINLNLVLFKTDIKLDGNCRTFAGDNQLTCAEVSPDASIECPGGIAFDATDAIAVSATGTATITGVDCPNLCRCGGDSAVVSVTGSGCVCAGASPPDSYDANGTYSYAASGDAGCSRRFQVGGEGEPALHINGIDLLGFDPPTEAYIQPLGGGCIIGLTIIDWQLCCLPNGSNGRLTGYLIATDENDCIYTITLA